MAKGNPVVEVYKGVTIRKSNVYQIRFNAVKYKFLLLECERTGLPISKILALSSKPCEKCSGIDIVYYGKDDEEIRIKKGILYNSMPVKEIGTSIIKQANAKKH